MLDIFSGYAVLGIVHFVYDGKPCLQRRCGFVKYCSRRRVCMMTAIITGVARSFGDFMMFAYPVALRAFDTVRIKLVFQPLETGSTIGKFMLEIYDSMVSHMQAISPSILKIYMQKTLAVKYYHLSHLNTN